MNMTRFADLNFFSKFQFSKIPVSLEKAPILGVLSERIVESSHDVLS